MLKLLSFIWWKTLKELTIKILTISSMNALSVVLLYGQNFTGVLKSSDFCSLEHKLCLKN